VKTGPYLRSETGAARDPVDSPDGRVERTESRSAGQTGVASVVWVPSSDTWSDQELPLQYRK
jgi:hypothetical protein